MFVMDGQDITTAMSIFILKTVLKRVGNQAKYITNNIQDKTRQQKQLLINY